MEHKRNIAVIGLGYVGLPLALALAKKSKVIGYDISSHRIEELKQNNDVTKEVFPEDFATADIDFTSNESDLTSADFFIITVPTPVDDNNKPDLFCLMAASETVGKYLKHGDIVVYESTVYPGCTEDDCAPMLEKTSGLKSGVDFKLGYSPERINPSDRLNTLDKVVKIVSGQDQEALDIVSSVYEPIITAGIYKAESIKIAEAAKILENTQRDVNISLMNEVATLFDKLGVDSNKVIDAASTKWNFVSLRPGLVGGHCIGIDPYYLIERGKQVGSELNLIKTARAVNDGMSEYIVNKTIDKLSELEKELKDCTVAVLGVSFKENCPDLRNSRPLEIIQKFKQQGYKVLIHDPYARNVDLVAATKDNLTPWENIKDVDAMIINIAHDFYKELQASDLINRFKSKPLVMDVRSVLDQEQCEKAGIAIWRL